MLLLPDIYGFCLTPACVGSYFFNSGFRALTSASAGPWVDFGLGFRCLGLLAGGCPAATHFSLLRERKVSKRKATRLSGSLRFATGNLRCPEKTGVGANSLHFVTLKQRAALIPFFQVITGPDRTGRGRMQEVRNTESLADFVWAPSPFRGRLGWGLCELEARHQTPLRQRFTGLLTCQCLTTAGPHPSLPPEGGGARKEKSIFVAAPVLVPAPAPAPVPVPVPVPASPVLSGPASMRKNGIRAARCLSRRRVCADPRFSACSQVARSEAQGPRQPGRLSFAYFSLAKQRKVSCRRATPGQQANAAKTEARIKHRLARRRQATGTKP